MRDNDLLDWRIRKIRARRLEARISNLRGLLLRFVQKYHPSCLALKVVDPAMSSPLVNQLVEEIRAFCKEEQLPLEEYTLVSLKNALGISKKRNKRTMAEALSAEYPVLYHTLHPSTSKKRFYHGKMFEALAAAKVCSANGTLTDQKEAV